MDLTRPATLPALAVLAVGCGGSEPGPFLPEGPTNTIVTAFKDAPVDGLQSFSLVVDSIALFDSSGNVTDYVGFGRRRIEFLGLQDRVELHSGGYTYDRTFAGARILFEPDTIEAVGQDGTMVQVDASVETFDVWFPSPITLSGNGPLDFTVDLHLVLDLDLERSISGSTSAPPLRFEPEASLLALEDGPYRYEAIDGTITELEDEPGTFLLQPIEITIGTETTEPLSLGPPSYTFQLASNAVVLDESGAPLPDLSAYVAAQGGFGTSVEVHATLGTDGSLLAHRVEVQSLMQALQSSELEGRVTSITPGEEFELLLLDVENSAHGLAGLLSQSTPPHRFTVQFDTDTLFIDDTTHVVGAETDLAVGQRVDVRLVDHTLPLRTDRVEIESAPLHRATITDTTGLPESVIVRLPAGAPAIAAGLVADGATDVTVSLDGTDLLLSARGERSIPAGALVDGVAVDLAGALEGLPTAPTLAAQRIRVVAGELTGRVTAASAAVGTFEVAVDSISDPFGSGASAPPFFVTLDPGCTFEGAATEMSAFFLLFAQLAPGESLRVELAGLGTGTANAIRAYAVSATVN